MRKWLATPSANSYKHTANHFPIWVAKPFNCVAICDANLGYFVPWPFTTKGNSRKSTSPLNPEEPMLIWFFSIQVKYILYYWYPALMYDELISPILSPYIANIRCTCESKLVAIYGACQMCQIVWDGEEVSRGLDGQEQWHRVISEKVTRYWWINMYKFISRREIRLVTNFLPSLILQHLIRSRHSHILQVLHHGMTISFKPGAISNVY